MKRKGYRVIPQMFDVRPVDEAGNFDAEKFKSLEKIVRLPEAVRPYGNDAQGNNQRTTASRDGHMHPPVNDKPFFSSSGQECVSSERKQNIIAPKVSQLVLNRKVSCDLEIPFFIQSSYIPASQRIIFDEILERHAVGYTRTGNAVPLNRQAITPITIKGYDHWPVPARKNQPAVPSSPNCREELFFRKVAGPEPETIKANPYDFQPTEVPVALKVGATDNATKKKLENFYASESRGWRNDLKERKATVKPRSAKKRRKKKKEETIGLQTVPATDNEQGFSLGKLMLGNYSRNASAFVRDGFGVTHLIRPAFSFCLALFFCAAMVGGGVLVSRGWQLKDKVVVKGQQAIGYLASAQDDLKNQDFEAADQKLERAKEEFEGARQQLDSIGGDLLDIFSGLPYLSKASSGKNVIDAGEKLTQTAQNFNRLLEVFSQIDNPLDAQAGDNKSLVEVLSSVNEEVGNSKQLLIGAKNDLDNVTLEDLPEEHRVKFSKVKEALPVMIRMTEGFRQNYHVLLDILGHHGPRKYLFVFQNNQEMRATGGFIGSYGIMDINNGHIKNLFIDGIYNPDGQLRENVIPPKPIMKISAAWSTHDANWYPNFPTSAEKIAWFYEKTGGPTVDGVISVTPTVLQKMLEITGPVEMPEYDTVVDSSNFVEKTQYEVEVDYDKEMNRPKQFIADLAPVILDKLFAVRDASQMSKAMQVLSSAFKEKHILIYSYNYDIQQIVSRQGWSGEVLQTSRDYLMVINSNINGFKTDGVIDESITHRAEVQPDGAIVDTVTIKRIHNGGDSDYEWWNKVNSDYMRVYVPKGSRLIDVKGQTREFNQPPLDYDQLGFRKDPTVVQEEQSMEIDEDSGTRIYEEDGKTVFANWVYVSPKETVEIEYKYLLPFKVDWYNNKDKVDTYSLLAQKQSGSIGSKFQTEVKLPDGVNVVWKYPEASEVDKATVKYSNALTEDRFIGFVLQGR